jgi:serine protease Do
VFSQALPHTVADLKAIEKHVQELVPKIAACTVNLKIGRAQGTGVIISPEGLILTAAHVAGRPGTSISITMSDGSRVRGTALGRDRTLDASVVQIDSDRKDWPSVPLADEAANPGDWCLVLGHPGGYVKDRGLVLRLGRVVDDTDWLIQTDCELVGGDSGGPLCNMRGEVIGINTRIGASVSSNYHVPSEVFRKDWDRLLASEDFRTHSGAYLGVSGIPAPSGRGLLIQKVYPGDPAERAGVEDGDILLSFQGTPVTDLDQLIELVGEEYPQQVVSMVILHQGETKELTVRLGRR